MEIKDLQALHDNLVGERERIIEAMTSGQGWTMEQAQGLAAVDQAASAVANQMAMPAKPKPTGPRVVFGEDGNPR